MKEDEKTEYMQQAVRNNASDHSLVDAEVFLPSRSRKAPPDIKSNARETASDSVEVAVAKKPGVVGVFHEGENDTQDIAERRHAAAVGSKEKRRILSMERHIHIRQGPMGIPMIQDTVVIEREPSTTLLFVFFLKLVIMATVVQSFFFLWSRFHKKSSKAFVLVLLYAFPALLSRVMWVLWAVYLAVVVYYVKFAKQPYMLFRFFCVFLRSMYVCIFASQVLLLAFFLLRYSITVPLLLFVISVYFSTLSKESVHFLTSVIYLPHTIPKGSCFICIKKISKGIYTLSCSHSFHSDCIKGWVLLGKRSYCPHCNEHIGSMNLSFVEEKFEFFNSILDYARNFIVFILFVYAYIRISSGVASS